MSDVTRVNLCVEISTVSGRLESSVTRPPFARGASNLVKKSAPVILPELSKTHDASKSTWGDDQEEDEDDDDEHDDDDLIEHDIPEDKVSLVHLLACWHGLCAFVCWVDVSHFPLAALRAIEDSSFHFPLLRD